MKINRTNGTMNCVSHTKLTGHIMDGGGMEASLKILGLIILLGVVGVVINMLGVNPQMGNSSELQGAITPTPTPTSTIQALESDADYVQFTRELDEDIASVEGNARELDTLEKDLSGTEAATLEKELSQVTEEE